jgi:hypothetical protein
VVPTGGRAAYCRFIDVKQVKFVVDYGMVSHGLAPLFVDGHATELGFWGFNSDIMRRLARLNELYDRQINWKNPHDGRYQISDRDRAEFNALLPFVVSEIELALGDQWEVVIDTKPI